ncbi:hypothetical protein J2S53_004291 [Actinopolyspora lacussalsi]|nr:hypothetical protein [Actinopolyspora lacussalsi]
MNSSIGTGVAQECVVVRDPELTGEAEDAAAGPETK